MLLFICSRFPRQCEMMLLLLCWLTTLAGAEPINQRCPVLPQEAVDPAITMTWQGQIVGLCCQRCRRQFLEDPGAYAARLPAITAAATSGSQPTQVPKSVAQQSRVMTWLGRFHPAIVHLPIALIVTACFAEILAMLSIWPAARTAARFCLITAALSAAPAAVFGWCAAGEGGHPGLETVLAWHRWLGIGVAVGVVAVAGALEVVHRRSITGPGRFTPVVGLVLLSLIVGVVGHLGGVLVFGAEHFSWPR